MKKFTIDIAYATSVYIKEVFPLRQKEGESDEDFLIRKLKSCHATSYSIRTEDHPEFAKLRDNLESLGYIKTDRNSWNGDVVLKTFMLNNVKFKTHNRFPCAAAISYNLKHGKSTL